MNKIRSRLVRDLKSKIVKNTFLKISCLFFSLFVSIIFPCHSCPAADLNDLYQQLVKKNAFLYEGELSYFDMREEGIHGHVNYENFDSQPHIYSFDNLLTFSPLECLELALGFNQAFFGKYKRSTYSAAGTLAVVQRYDLEYFRDYILHLRLRYEPAEFYLDILEKNQKDNWKAEPYPAALDYFTYMRSHYEDFKTGIRYLRASSGGEEESNLSKLKRPLLDHTQLNIEAELGYKKGVLRRNVYYYSGGLTFLNFYHQLTGQLIPKLNLRYGLSKDLEMESGLSYITPFKYKFEYKTATAIAKSLLQGTYRLDNSIQFPLRLRYRPKSNLEVMFSSDFSFADQKLYYWYVDTTGTVTTYPTKKLSYYNTQPTLVVSYLYDDNKKIAQSEFSRLTKELLLKGQCLMELKYQKDITALDKNSTNGPQNIIDPYNVFMYPVDYFVAGSEYAAFFTGNTSSSATNVLPQNYYIYQLNFKYGLTDKLNAGFGVGYHSSSHLHHFTLGNPVAGSYDLKSRFYKFKPYYFFDTIWDWRVTQNSIISFSSHFVPEYTSLLTIEGQPQEYKAKDSYFTLTLGVKFLF
ncbi:MAG: hypothetical protein Q8N49_01045 [Candidatus Omnitrophota bacterium]|nr:hypothetical protein [Candidatus Omnitrophota bacterium]